MKSIVFSNYDDLGNPYYGGGGARAIHETAKRLARKYHVTVMTGNYPGARNKTVAGVTYRRIGYTWMGPKLGQIIFHALLPFKIMTHTFDVWFEGLTPPISTSCLQLFTHKPVVGITHMLSGREMERKYKFPFRFFERLGLKTYRHLVVLTEELKKEVQKYSRAHVSVITNGVTLPQTKSGQNHIKKHILFLGRLEIEQKGLDLLLKAFGQIASATRAKLVIAGTGHKDQEVKLHELITKSKLTGRVNRVGWVSGKKKDRLFREAYCIIVPSRSESYSLVALEALSYNVPVICFDIPELTWLPTKYVFKVKSFSVTDLAITLAKMVNNRNFSRHYAGGAAFARKYTWEKVATEYDTLIGTLVVKKTQTAPQRLVFKSFKEHFRLKQIFAD